MLQRGATTTRDAGFMQFCRSLLRCGTSSDSSREYLTPYTIEGLRLSQVLLSIKGVFHHLLGSTFCICGMFQGGCLQKGPDARAQEANAEGTEQWIKLLIVTVTGLMREPQKPEQQTLSSGSPCWKYLFGTAAIFYVDSEDVGRCSQLVLMGGRRSMRQT